MWPVFWFSYVLESHKLKTGRFPDLIQVTCPFFVRVCPHDSSVLSGHSASVLPAANVLSSLFPALPGRPGMLSLAEEGEGWVPLVSAPSPPSLLLTLSCVVLVLLFLFHPLCLRGLLLQSEVPQDCPRGRRGPELVALPLRCSPCAICNESSCL